MIYCGAFNAPLPLSLVLYLTRLMMMTDDQMKHHEQYSASLQHVGMPPYGNENKNSDEIGHESTK